MKHASLLIVLIGALVAACERSVTEHDAALDQRGFGLRQSILDEYARLKAKKIPADCDDLGPIISHYIPVGTPFPDAIRILKAGNFALSPPCSYRYGNQQIFLVSAQIALESTLLKSTTYAYVNLHVDKIEPTPTQVIEPQGSISTTCL